jgi:hypothetical protein
MTTFAEWKREQNITITRCTKHDLSVCATCSGHDTEEDMATGRPVTPRTLPPGITVGEAHFAGTWDRHSPYEYCTDPMCCDPVHTMRGQTGLDTNPHDL